MSWKIDTAHSLLEFSVKHMMISTVRGRFTKFDGTITVDEKNLLDSSVVGTVDIASIDTHDAGRDGHLRSADFFDVEKHPQMIFRSTRIQQTGDGEYKVTGDLTIKNTTREVTFNVTDEGRNKDPWGNLRWGFSATTSINRKDFGLTWNVALETGGVLVGEQVKIAVELEVIQTPDTSTSAA